MKNILQCIDAELLDRTSEWFKVQQDVTITLDVGTVYGLPLLAVPLIGDRGKTKLADIMPIVSKKGSALAEICVEACSVGGRLQQEILSAKIVGVTGDGAFAKGNSTPPSRP